MSDCFYCGEDFKDMYHLERNCSNCKNNWAFVCHPCFEVYKDSGHIGWDRHYQTHHHSVDLV